MCLAVADEVLHAEVCHFGCDGASHCCPARGRKGTKKERRGFPLRSVKLGVGRNLLFYDLEVVDGDVAWSVHAPVADIAAREGELEFYDFAQFDQINLCP